MNGCLHDCKIGLLDDTPNQHNIIVKGLSQYRYGLELRQTCVDHKETYIGDASKEEVCCASNAYGYKPLKRWSINDVVIGRWHTLLHCL